MIRRFSRDLTLASHEAGQGTPQPSLMEDIMAIIRGTTGNDQLYGDDWERDDYDDTIYGFAGNDELWGNRVFPFSF